jgi:hypothetical protein
VLATSLLPGTSASATVKSGISPTVREALLRLALHAATRWGDPHPDDIQAVRTTPSTHVVPENPAHNNYAWVYLVAMRGHFKPQCRKGAAAGAANGPGCPSSVGELIVDPALEPLSWSQASSYPNLRAKGAVPVRLGASKAK